ncbi:MAG: hypothetical protein FJ087_05650 [Deltaproteobacteria bacterium]|nr:hypothetical protein [Deltaproteobacteria bacterium]
MRLLTPALPAIAVLGCAAGSAPAGASVYEEACLISSQASRRAAERCAYEVTVYGVSTAIWSAPAGPDDAARRCRALAAMFEAQTARDAISFDLDAMRACAVADDAEGACTSRLPGPDLLGGMPGCPGAMTGRRLEGGPCLHEAECAEGLHCKAPGCGGQCEKALAEGGTCNAGVLGGARCGPGLACVWSGSGQTCVKGLARGQECGSAMWVPCAAGTTCFDGRCRAAVLSTSTPPACGTLGDGSIAVCPEGFTCSGTVASSWLSGSCVAAAPAEAGAQCWQDSACLPDLRCDPAARTCAAWLKAGDGCAPDPQSGRKTDSCGPGLACDGERCVAYMGGEIGARCGQGDACASGLCWDGACIGPVNAACPSE